jgi:hypothetical protein
MVFQNSSFLWAALRTTGLVTGLLLGVSCTTPASESVAAADSWKEEARFLALDEGRFYLLPLNNPSTVPAGMAFHMSEADLIAGIEVNGRRRAYPLWILVAYHVVNDTLDDSPVLLSHCEACSGASAFRPVLDPFEGKSLTFQIHGIAHGTFSIYDYQTQTVWSPFTGRTLEGQLHPSRMQRIPLVLETWGAWVKRFPETEVVFASRIMVERREHGRGGHSVLGDPFVPDFFAATANMDDTRLGTGDHVFGIEAGEAAVAFPLQRLEEEEEILRYPFQNQFYLIKKISQFGVLAFRLAREQEDSAYHLISKIPFRIGDDRGGVWDEFGNSLSEDPEAQKLVTADGYFTEWYEWVSSYPQSEIADW